MFRLSQLLASLGVLSLLISCVPKTKTESSLETAMTQTQTCSLEVDLRAFNLMSQIVSETEASYRVVLRSPLRELSGELRKQLEANGWEFVGAARKSRADNSYSAHYTCTERETPLWVSINPVGRSLIYMVHLALG